MSRALACLAGALTFASACTGSGSVDSASDIDDVPGELAFIEEPEIEPVLRIALTRGGSGDGSGVEPADFELADFDPLLISLNDQSAVVVSDLLYDGLTEAVGRSGELRPGLALSWEANESFTRWDFVLDLERTSAPEVKQSFERLIGSDGLMAALFDDVVGVEAFLVGDASTVLGLVALADGTFSIRLSHPDAGLAWLLSGVGFSVVGEDGGLTGRYVIDSSSAVDDSDAAEEPALDSVVLRSDEAAIELVWASDDGAASEADLDASALLASGLVDVAVVDRSLLPSPFEGNVVLGSSQFVVLNGASAEMRDLLKREAVVANIDAEALGQASHLAAAGDGGVLSSALAGFEPDGCVWCEVSADRQRDLAQVAPTIAPLVIGYVDAEQEAVTDLLVEQLGQAGLSVSAVEMASSELAAAVADGSVDLFLFGWVAPSGSLDGSIGPLFASSGFNNVFGIGSAEVDALLAQARLVGDDQDRWAMLREAEVKALSQFVAVPYGSEVAGVLGVDGIDELVVRADGSFDLVGVG